MSVFKYDALIVANGKGSRASLGYNKVLYKLKDNKTVLEHASSLFLNDDDCQKVIIVTDVDIPFNNPKIVKVSGGDERKKSVANGLKEVNSEYVLIHDGARPFLNIKSLEKLKQKVKECDYAILGSMAVDTVKEVSNGYICKTIDRNNIFLASTPQGFKSSTIKKCYEECKNIMFTDDSSLLELKGYKVAIVIDEYDNHKLTSKEDFKNL